MVHPAAYFMLDTPIARALFDGCAYVWDALPRIAPFVAQLVGTTQTIEGKVMRGAHLGERPVFIAAGAVVEPGAYVLGPAYIGPGAIVRHGAFVRENVLLLDGAILGHAGEAKNALFLPGAHAPHFNYVGDSILGARVNLGAGTKLSNLGLTSEKDPATGSRSTIHIATSDTTYDTGLAKLGAILGDGVQTGCNAVLNPGCLIGPESLVYANASVRKGVYPARSILKLRQTLEITHRN